MKCYLPAISIMICLLISCKKSDTIKQSITFTSIKGKWELRVRVGIQMPGAPGYYLPGNGEIWSFTDSTYQYFVSNQLYESGFYSIAQDTFPQTGKLMNKLIFRSYPGDGLFYELSADTLIIYRGNIASDGSIDKFLKQ